MYYVWCNLLLLSSLIVLCLSSPEAVYPPCWITDWYPKPYTLQYQSWYNKYQSGLQSISTTTCNSTLNAYRQGFIASPGSPESQQLLCRCIQHERCLLENLSLDVMANFQSATVLLGVMPTLLANLGPSIAEISLLSTYRPFLSFLLSMGGPSVWPTRVFQYNNPAAILVPIDADNHSKLVLATVPNKILSLAISAIQYLFAMGAIANVVMTSIELGQKTILSWGCTTTFLPLVWVCAASVIHVVAATSYAVASRKVRNSPAAEGDSVRGSRRGSGPISYSRPRRQTVSHIVPRICQILAKETTICANQDKREYDSTAVPTGTMALNILAGCCSFIHIVFGSVVFSSIQFVSVWDVLNQILWRYILSTVICRLLLIMEFAGLRNGSGNGHSSDDDPLVSGSREVELFQMSDSTI